jgi:L-aspartate oxidase
VAVVTSGGLGGGSTVWAQGGVAAAIADDDDPQLHASDTEVAGAGLCDVDAVRLLTSAAPVRIAELIDVGARFDRLADGTLALGREGGHRRKRVVHAGGDATGAEVSRTLVAELEREHIEVFEHTAVLDVQTVLTAQGRQATGLVVRRNDAAETVVIGARAVVLATGGLGGVFRASTNPADVTGHGLALALRAGATLVDLEFVQFHPTALRVTAVGQVPLISEALRGEGAVLRDGRGRPIMAGHHPMADLAPRDIVARRIDTVIAESPAGTNLVVLDATGLGPDLAKRFPTVTAICRRHGIDPTREPIPVMPAEHFLCGGVRTDEWGATDVSGLYAIGEVAATGVHGANRLASNSLLEGLVFGGRLAARLRERLPADVCAGDLVSLPMPQVPGDAIPEIQATMSRHAGVRRSGAGIDAATGSLRSLLRSGGSMSYDAAHRWVVAGALLAAAGAREESRGCHWRSDYPTTDDLWRHRIAVRLDELGRPVAAPSALELAVSA